MTIQATAGSEFTAENIASGSTGFHSITALADGGWVITSFGLGPNGISNAVYQQRFTPDGTAMGSPTVVNTDTSYNAGEPAVTALADGGWVVTWTYQTGGSDFIGHQRYASDGSALGGEAAFDSAWPYVGSPAISSLADGGWVISWQSNFADGNDLGISQRRFDANGQLISQGIVNTRWQGDQAHPDVIPLDGGGWLVVWSHSGRVIGPGIYFQRYAADGTSLGFENPIEDSYTNGDETPVAAALADGGWLIVWMGGNDEHDIRMQRFAADGSLSGSETLVNTTTVNAQWSPDVAGLADGGWVVVWQSADPSGAGIYMQRYAADGTAVGGETLVNSTTVGNQIEPVVTALANGGWVVSWASEGDIVHRWYAPDIDGTAADDTISGTVLGELMRGLAGDDVYQVNSIYDVVEEDANGGTDTVRASVTFTLGDNVEHLVLTGSANIDATGNDLDNRLTGNTGDNLLRGMAGDDTLDGKAGADTMEGGAGNDTYYVDDVGDVVRETASAGSDTVRAALSYALSAHVENLVLTGTANIDATGNGLANRLTGNSGDNVLNGAAGADTMIGGAGDDTYYVDNAGDVVTERSGGGHDTVDASVSHTLAAYVEDLVLIGSASINGTGNGLANMIVGNAGNNVLNGGGGADTMLGRTGNDTYYVDNAGDIVVEAANAGTDTVRASRSYTLGSNVENLVLTGTGNLSGTGNSLANVITGNTGNNTLSGAGGNDILRGSNGNDSLLGGSGNDRLEGGSGNDRLTGGAGSDKLYGGTGADRFVFTSLSDSTVSSSGRDTILDFSRSQGDKIDLSAIDASTKSSGNQAFSFIGEKSAFSGAAGELRYVNSGGDTFIYADVNGDRKADFAIRIDATIDFVKGDFIL
ncbi:calcium-binding protein [Ciceribacter sp. L1K23]|uniref:calcium-binding protein n=1 Tax=Ciceribacter sp. L1K23 TaxID=2820276 RepID=UPI001B8402C3|nr:calcium-binding protein [Ciceribacter sp. L1K23]MBR0556581.1 calcium-binding protein [Ciceribacter sp. L1K23]